MLITPLIPDTILYTINNSIIVHMNMNSLITYLYVYDLILKYSSKHMFTAAS